jgi:hypothetical protein
MNNVEVQVSDTEILMMFSQLSFRKMKTARKKALQKSANILIKQTRANLRHIVKGSTKTTSRATKNGKSYQLNMSKGIRSKVNDDATEAKVNIMADFRLKFFEMGTDDRKLKGLFKHGAYRGAIKAFHFFQMAKEQTEKEVFSTMDENLRQAILKVASK